MADDTKTPKSEPVLHLKMDQLHPDADTDGQSHMTSQGPNPEVATARGDLSLALDDVFGKALSFSGTDQEVFVPIPQGEEPEDIGE